MTTQWDVGDLLRITGTFTNFAGADTDPGTIVFKHRKPDGTITTSTFPTNVTKTATGIYYSDVVVDVEGAHWFRFAGTGAVIAAKEEAIQVKASMFV